MDSIKQYRVKLLCHDEVWQEFTTINEVNQYISRDIISRNSSSFFQGNNFKNTGFIFVKPENYLVYSYDWDRLEFLPSHFGFIKNTMCK